MSDVCTNICLSCSHSLLAHNLSSLVVAIVYSKFIIIVYHYYFKELFFTHALIIIYDHSYTLMFEFNLLSFWEVDDYIFRLGFISSGVHSQWNVSVSAAVFKYSETPCVVHPVVAPPTHPAVRHKLYGWVYILSGCLYSLSGLFQEQDI